LIVSLFAVAKIKAFYADDVINLNVVAIDVVIDGHVKKPGVFSVIPGTPIGSVIKKAAPKKYANFREISMLDPILVPMKIDIKTLSDLRVRVIGELENPGEFQLEIGSRISDLKKIITLTEETDENFLSQDDILTEEFFLMPGQEMRIRT